MLKTGTVLLALGFALAAGQAAAQAARKPVVDPVRKAACRDEAKRTFRNYPDSVKGEMKAWKQAYVDRCLGLPPQQS